MSNELMAVSDTRAHPPSAAHASPRRDLIELLAAVSHVKAEITASEAQVRSGLDAAERIQDVAFALRERGADAALCQALDAAVREFSNACALNNAAMERARKAANLLREFAAMLPRSANEAGTACDLQPLQSDNASRLTGPALMEASPIEVRTDERADSASNFSRFSSLEKAEREEEVHALVNAAESREGAALPVPPTSSDPLAAARVLSEEEIIALFS